MQNLAQTKSKSESPHFYEHPQSHNWYFRFIVPNLFVVVDVQAVENLFNLMLLTSGNAVKVPVFPEQITVVIVIMANTYSIKYVYIYIY